MRNKVLFSLIFISFFGTLNAQRNFKTGYIIKPGGDTLYGEIDYRNNLMMGHLCRFRHNKIIKEYLPFEIAGYRYSNGRYFVSKKYNNVNVFLEFLVNGKLNLYYLRDKHGDHYFIEKNGNNLAELHYEKGIKYVDDIPYEYVINDQIDTLLKYTQDDPQLKSDIVTLSSPTNYDLTKLAQKYHTQVCNGEKCIIYRKPAPFVKLVGLDRISEKCF